DADDLVHPRLGPGVCWRERWRGHHPVEITQDGLRLVEPEVAVIEHRHAPEGVAREVFRALARARIEAGDAIVGAFFLEPQKGCTDIGAAGNAMNDEFSHLNVSCSIEDFRRLRSRRTSATGRA